MLLVKLLIIWRARREAPTILRRLCTSSRIRRAYRAFDTTKVYQFANVPKRHLGTGHHPAARLWPFFPQLRHRPPFQ